MNGVTKIVEYKCNICNSKHNTRESAQECFDKGLMVKYPIGMIYGNHTKGAFYEKITFAVATNETDKWNSHLNTGASWACRDIMGVGDSLGESMCGLTYLTLSEYDSKLNMDTPHFKRMVNYLIDKVDRILVWDGEKPIKLVNRICKNCKYDGVPGASHDQNGCYGCLGGTNWIAK